jgi:glutamine amidotransferase
MSHQVAHSNHGGDFPAIIGSENIFGVQFHPEKSSSAGFKLIKNFCGL